MNPMSDKMNLRVNPNRADLEALTSLPGIGDALAGRIIAARPYENVEDLLRVSGLGKAALKRLKPHIDFDQGLGSLDSAGEEGEIDEEQALKGAAEATEGESLEPEPTTRPPSPSAARRLSVQSPWRDLRRSMWFVLSTAAVSVILSILLTLAILGGINRTIDIGKHASIRQLESDLADVRVEVQGIASRMDALSRRMEAIEGLSGRIQTLEDSFAGLQAEVAQSMETVERMRSLVQDLDERVSELSQTYARFDTFLDGLRQLLETLPEEAQPEPSAQP